MIKINFSPVRSDVKTIASVKATTVTLNGVDYELSELPDGATATHQELGAVSRSGDNYELIIRLAHGANAPHKTRFPDPVEITGTEWTLEYDYDLAE